MRNCSFNWSNSFARLCIDVYKLICFYSWYKTCRIFLKIKIFLLLPICTECFLIMPVLKLCLFFCDYILYFQCAKFVCVAYTAEALKKKKKKNWESFLKSYAEQLKEKRTKAQQSKSRRRNISFYLSPRKPTLTRIRQKRNQTQQDKILVLATHLSFIIDTVWRDSI